MTSITFGNFQQNTANASNAAVAAGGLRPPTPFRTRYMAQDRVSEATTILAMHYDEKLKQIRVVCADTRVRKCNIERLPSVEAGRLLWTQLATAGEEGRQVRFVAAGGFSPDNWFYTVS